MENAAKALVISGGVLLAIIILSVGVYLRGRLQNTATAYAGTLDVTELRKFNSQFEVYTDIDKDITAQDIVTLIGIAQKTEYDVKIIVDGMNMAHYADDEKHLFLKDNIYKMNSDGTVENAFQFLDIHYNDDQRVDEIWFKKK